MLRSIDHIVIAVPDLDGAIKSYESLGFTVVAGGRHTVGTHNALIAFADGAYIELIAFFERNPDHRWWGPLQKGGGLVDYCLTTDALREDTEAFRKAGVAIDDPIPRNRFRPDGYEVKWVLSNPRPEHRFVAPFLIEDVTPRTERVPDETGHPNGVTGIGTVTIAVDDVTPVRGWYERVLGRPGTETQRRDLEAAGVTFEIGPHRLEFVAPVAGRGPIAEWIRTRGACPYAAALRATSASQGPLDPRRALGARLFLVA